MHHHYQAKVERQVAKATILMILRMQMLILRATEFISVEVETPTGTSPVARSGS